MVRLELESVIDTSVPACHSRLSFASPGIATLQNRANSKNSLVSLMPGMMACS